jgi:hypothetical protein
MTKFHNCGIFSSNGTLLDRIAIPSGQLPAAPNYQLVSPHNAVYYARYRPQLLKGNHVMHLWAVDYAIERFFNHNLFKYAKILKDAGYKGIIEADLSITGANTAFDDVQMQRAFWLTNLFNGLGLPVLRKFRLCRTVPIEKQLLAGTEDVAVSLVSESPECVAETGKALTAFGIKRVLAYGKNHLPVLKENFTGEIFSYVMTSNQKYIHKKKKEDAQ